MILEIATVVALARQCAPSVAVETLVSVAHAESHFDPYAIGVNAKGVRSPQPVDRTSAVGAARSLIAQGYNIDLGLGQINSANLQWLGLSVEDAFDPCRNLAASARVLSTNYLSVTQSSPTTEAAIATAISMYNTGSRSRGFGNGYVSRVYASSSIVIPAIHNGLIGVTDTSTARPSAPARPAAAAARAQDLPTPWDTTAGAQAAQLIVFGTTFTRLQKGQAE